MVIKVSNEIVRLEQIEMPIQLAHVYYNEYFIKSIYFRIGIMELSKNQKNTLVKIYESTLLSKLEYSKKFLQRVLYTRKSPLGIGIMRPETIVDTLALKLYFGYKRAETRIGNLIQVIEDIALIESGCNRNILEVPKEE